MVMGQGGDGFCLLHPHPPTPIYLPVTLPILNGDEKLNHIPVSNGFEYSRTIPVPALNQFVLIKKEFF